MTTQANPAAYRIVGTVAINFALDTGESLNKFADPTEDAREGLTVSEAREIAAVDPDLVYLDLEASTSDIKAIQIEAGAHGDFDQVAICDRALDGDAAARRECARVLFDAWAAAAD